MKILHFSDTHLGFHDLEIINEEGINQREVDFYNAFSQVVEQIIEIRPDYIIHTGDLFHRITPSNRAIAFALSQFHTINQLGIPFILIAGNHSTPRSQISTPILKIFENFENIYLSYEQRYKKISFDTIAFHTIPHINDTTTAQKEIELCEKSIEEGKRNIMMLHCSVGAYYLMEEFGEWVYPKEKEYIFEKMDYVALGHWHGFGNVGSHSNVYYSGSTERTTLNDKRNEKGFIVAELEESIRVNFHPITIRPIVEKKIDCAHFEHSLALLDTTGTKDAIVEVTLQNMTPLQSIEIQNREITTLFQEAMSVKVKRQFLPTKESKLIEDMESLSLEKYFLAHIKESSPPKEFQRLKQKIENLFQKYEESYDDTL